MAFEMRILEIKDERGLIHLVYIKDEWTITIREEVGDLIR